MQTGKNAVGAVKEATSNIAASAKSGMDKTKATMQEKVDLIKAQDDHEKALATEKKTEHLMDAELRKQQAMSHNAAEKDAKAAVEGAPPGTLGGILGNTDDTPVNSNEPRYSNSSTGAPGHPTGAHQMSALPGHGTGEPTGGHIVDGTQTGSHPIGKATGINTRSTMAENRHVGGGTGTGYAG